MNARWHLVLDLVVFTDGSIKGPARLAESANVLATLAALDSLTGH